MKIGETWSKSEGALSHIMWPEHQKFGASEGHRREQRMASILNKFSIP